MDSVKKRINALREKKLEINEEMSELMKELSDTQIANYLLKTLEGEATTLNECFGEHKELIVLHNMGPSCPYCTLWANGLNGFTKYFEQRCAFVLETDCDFETQREFAIKQGWKFNLINSKDSGFKEEMGFKKDGKNIPGISTFFKKEGKIYHHWSEELGPGDDFCSIWHLFDRLKFKSSGWTPKD